MMTSSEKEIAVQKFQSLLRRVEGTYISYKKAVRIVGGEKRLHELMESDRLRFSKPFGSINTMWRFNLVDVINSVKPYPEYDSLKYPNITVQHS